MEHNHVLLVKNMTDMEAALLRVLYAEKNRDSNQTLQGFVCKTVGSSEQFSVQVWRNWYTSQNKS